MSSSSEKQSINDDSSTEGNGDSNKSIQNSLNDSKSSMSTALTVNEENSVLMDIVKEQVQRTYVRIERNRNNPNQLLYVTKQSQENWIKGTIDPPASRKSATVMSAKARECLLRSSLTKALIPDEIGAINLESRGTSNRKKQRKRRKNRRAKTDLKSYDEIRDRYETQELVKTIELESKSLDSSNKGRDKSEDKIDSQTIFITPSENLICTAIIENEKIDATENAQEDAITDNFQSFKTYPIDQFKTTAVAASESSDKEGDNDSYESSMLLAVPDDLVQCLQDYLEQLESESCLNRKQQLEPSSKPYSLYVTPTDYIVQDLPKQSEALSSVPMRKTEYDEQSSLHSSGYIPAPSSLNDDSITSDQFESVDDSCKVENFRFEKLNKSVSFSPRTPADSMIIKTRSSSYKSDIPYSENASVSISKESVKQEKSDLKVHSSPLARQPESARELTSESLRNDEQQHELKSSEDSYKSIQSSFIPNVLQEQRKSESDKIRSSYEQSFKTPSSYVADDDESSMLLQVDPTLSRMILDYMSETPPSRLTESADQQYQSPKSLDNVEKFDSNVKKGQEKIITLKNRKSQRQKQGQKMNFINAVTDKDDEQLGNLQSPLPTPKSSLNLSSKSMSMKSTVLPKPKSLLIKAQTTINEDEFSVNHRSSLLDQDEQEIEFTSKKPATLKFTVTPPISRQKDNDQWRTVKSPPSKAIDIELKPTATEVTDRSKESLYTKELILESNKKRIASGSASMTPTASFKSQITSIINPTILKQSQDDKTIVAVEDINRSIQVEIEPLETKTVILTSSALASGKEEVMVEAELLSPVSHKETSSTQYYLIRTTEKNVMPIEIISSTPNDKQQETEAKTIQLSPSLPKSSSSGRSVEHKSLSKSLNMKIDLSPSIIIARPKTTQFETKSLDEYRSSPMQPIVDLHDSTKYDMIEKLNQICEDDSSKLNKLPSPTSSKRRLYRKKLVSNVTTGPASRIVTSARLDPLHQLLLQAKIKQTTKVDKQSSEPKSFIISTKQQQLQPDEQINDDTFRQKMVDFYINEEEFASSSEDLANLELEFEKLPPPPSVVNPLIIESEVDRERKQWQEELIVNSKRLFEQIEQLKHRQKLHLANLHHMRRILESSNARKLKQQKPKENDNDSTVTDRQQPIMNNGNFLTIVTAAGAVTIAAIGATFLAIKYMF
ncbi:uncharacterized protein LOC124495071 isoform X1 [Dermatophagoides farinae]|uniref:uncharacterized protein LOC124495071 isoform X1 n=1 Tax=Dermatophagoides farinae TaxID=6954 RepID=UPI003F61DB3D